MDQWTNRVSLSLIVGVLCLTVHTGCAAYLAARQAEPKDLSVLNPGTPRTRVIASLGPPQTERYHGRPVDFFTIRHRDNGDWRMVRAIGHGVADLTTAGLWELLATPIELPQDRDFLTIKVTYDGDDQVVGHQTFFHGPTR